MWVHPERKILYTEFWKAYDETVNVIKNDSHRKTNHSERFCENEIHTQNIENFWDSSKLWLRKNNYNKGKA